MQTGYSKFLPSENIFKKPGLLVIIFAACFAFWYIDLWKPYNAHRNKNNFVWDVFGYYSYLPAVFCNQGSFEFTNGYADHNPIGPLNTHIPKYTYGMSILYAPFFGLASLISEFKGLPVDGFSRPYEYCLRWGSVFYVLLGLFILRKFLLQYFREIIVAIVLFAALFGNILFMYTYVQSEMTHGYLFCLFSIFLYLTQKWHNKPDFKYTFLLSIIFGLIVLIRPTEIFILLFFIFWGVKNRVQLREKFRLLTKKYLHLILLVIVPLLLWIPQFLFFKSHTGEYFYFAYDDEGFFWNDPQVLNILFSYRKGWLTYSPLMVLVFFGFFFIRNDFPLSKWLLFFTLLIMIYVYSCWWDWGYGGSFGAREFCQHIAYLSIPLASFLDFAFYSAKKYILKGTVMLLTCLFIFSCVFLNIGQTYQYQVMGILHFSGMSKEVYWDIFRKYQLDEDFHNRYAKYVKQPDFSKLKEGKERDK